MRLAASVPVAFELLSHARCVSLDHVFKQIHNRLRQFLLQHFGVL